MIKNKIITLIFSNNHKSSISMECKSGIAFIQIEDIIFKISVIILEECRKIVMEESSSGYKIINKLPDITITARSKPLSLA
jgi:hypothetical protein